MPLDQPPTPSAAPAVAARPIGPAAAPRTPGRLLGAWLLGMAFMVLVMIVLGGVTRLTGSGLSIMEWAPLSGALPPLSEAEWRRLFALYQTIPQYRLLHAGFGLDGFRHIFWLEWTHRLWGRLMGLAFAVPLALLWWRGAIPRALVPRLLGLLALGGLQGAVGWFMVASGFFPDSTAVSPYRLVAHLVLAVSLYAALLWTGLSVLRPAPRPARPGHVASLARACLCAVALTMLAGGFVAGLHAGLTYNTFPLMDGRLVPAGYAELAPFARNLTENVAAVQFDHRLLATATAVLALVTAAVAWRAGRPASMLRAGAAALGIVVLAQYGLGVATLLNVVPAGLAALHQATALLLLTAALCCLHAAIRTPEPRAAAPYRLAPQDHS